MAMLRYGHSPKNLAAALKSAPGKSSTTKRHMAESVSGLHYIGLHGSKYIRTALSAFPLYNYPMAMFFSSLQVTTVL